MIMCNNTYITYYSFIL